MSGKSGKPDLTGYNYGAISSLVLMADRSGLLRDKEPDGAPTSLAGRIDPNEMAQMGSRAIRQAPKDLHRKGGKIGDKQESSEKQSAKRNAEAASFSYADIIEVIQHFQGLTYRPRTAETREVSRLILSSVLAALVDKTQDIVRSAADAVLETIENDILKDFDKKEEIEQVIGIIVNEQLSQLVTLSKKITYYKTEDDLERKEVEIDEDGVAVVFDRDDEGFEIREEDDKEEDEEQGDGDIVIDGEVREEDLLGGESSRTFKAEKDIVSPHSIDAFWVQRQI